MTITTTILTAMMLLHLAFGAIAVYAMLMNLPRFEDHANAVYYAVLVSLLWPMMLPLMGIFILEQALRRRNVSLDEVE